MPPGRLRLPPLQWPPPIQQHQEVETRILGHWLLLLLLRLQLPRPENVHTSPDHTLQSRFTVGIDQSSTHTSSDT